jgi:3-hydroxybutyryl-CoA dehydrogenase
MDIRKVFVVGAGQMGNGIAQVCAQAGLEVWVSDTTEPFVKKGLAVIDKNLGRAVEKGRLTAEAKAAAMGLIHGVTDLAAAAGCDLVIEAVVESLAVKKEIFQKLDGMCRPEVVLATNTSSLPITEIAAFTGRPDKVIGMHFFNPVPVMQLVEVIRGLATSDETYRLVDELARKIGKTPVEVNDSPGFVANRLLVPMINEAAFCVYEGIATPEAVDNVMKLGMNHPMGPLALADLIGLDTVVSVLEVLYNGFGDPKYRPCPLLRKMVKAGRLGRKTGRGFYTYAA